MIEQTPLFASHSTGRSMPPSLTTTPPSAPPSTTRSRMRASSAIGHASRASGSSRSCRPPSGRRGRKETPPLPPPPLPLPPLPPPWRSSLARSPRHASALSTWSSRWTRSAELNRGHEPRDRICFWGRILTPTSGDNHLPNACHRAICPMRATGSFAQCLPHGLPAPSLPLFLSPQAHGVANLIACSPRLEELHLEFTTMSRGGWLAVGASLLAPGSGPTLNQVCLDAGVSLQIGDLSKATSLTLSGRSLGVACGYVLGSLIRYQGRLLSLDLSDNLLPSSDDPEVIARSLTGESAQYLAQSCLGAPSLVVMSRQDRTGKPCHSIALLPPRSPLATAQRSCPSMPSHSQHASHHSLCLSPQPQHASLPALKEGLTGHLHLSICPPGLSALPSPSLHLLIFPSTSSPSLTFPHLPSRSSPRCPSAPGA